MRVRFLAWFLVALVLVLGGGVLPAQAGEKKSAYTRVMETGTIRCGYLVYEPYLTKDLKTGTLGGLVVDYIEAVAARHQLKVEWVAEVNVDQIVTNLDYGRIDAFCVPATPDNNWATRAEFVADMGAWPYYTYVPVTSTLTRDQLNSARFVLVDGYNLSDTTKEHYPRAQFVSLPQTASAAEMYDQLKYGKADAFVNEPVSAAQYMKANPNTIRKLSGEILSAQRMFLMSQKGDAKMVAFLEKTFDADIPENGTLLKTLIAKYGLPSGALLVGEECKPFDTDLGWKMCTPMVPQSKS